MSTESASTPVFDLDPIGRNAKRASALLKAMSNPHRLYVLCQLANGEKSVGELEKIIGLSQSALSQHLAKLRRENLVKTRRQAQTIFYSLDGDQATRILDALYEVCSDLDDATPFGSNQNNPSRAALG